MQSQSGVLPRLLNCFFEGVTKPQRFAEGLRLLADTLDCDQIAIKLWDRRGNWACLRTARRLNGGWQLAVEDLPAPLPEWPKLAASLEPGCWNRLAIRPEKQDATGQDATRAPLADLSSSDVLMCLRLSTTKGAEGLMLVRQSTQQHPGNAGRLQIPAELIKSLITSLDLIAQFRQLNHRAACFSALLDTIRLPLLMLDHSLRLLAANRPAQSLIERVTLGTGKQCVSLQGVAVSRFSVAVRDACNRSASARGSVLLTGDQQETSRQVLVLPIMVRHSDKSDRVALVLVHGQGSSQASGQMLLQQAYGLTPAEGRLAMLIIEGHTPGDAAVNLKVGIATVRTQLSAILKKTGARKQTELIRRLSPLLMLDRQHTAH